MSGTDFVLYFLPLSGLIALVCAGTRHEAFDEILKGAKEFARASGGVLGLGPKISKLEREMIEQFEEALRSG